MTDKQILSLQNCEQVLKADFGKNAPPIIGFNIKPYSSEVVGILGEHLTVEISVKQNKKSITKSYFAKQFPFQHSLQSEFLLRTYGFKREVEIYSILLPKFVKTIPNYNIDYVPRFFFSKTNEVVVFEDIRELSYRIAKTPNLNQLDLKHIQLALKSLAKFHAGSLLYEHIKSIELSREYSLLEDMPQYLTEPLFTEDFSMGHDFSYAGLKGLIAVVDLVSDLKLKPDEFKNKFHELLKKTFAIMKQQKKYKNVVCHGDALPKNIMFRYENGDPIDCKLVDFQLLRYFPPAHDVLLFIYVSTSTEMRQHHFHSLLKYYHNHLKEVVEKAGFKIDDLLSYEEFKSSVHFILPAIKLQYAIQLSGNGIHASNPEFVKKLLQNEEDFRKFLYQDRGPFSLELYKNDDSYKYLLTKSLWECEEIILYPIISREDCYEIIEKKLGTTYYKLLSFELVSCNELPGLLGDYLKLKIKIQHQWKELEYRFFIKRNPVEKQTGALVEDLSCFFKEIFFYDKFERMVGDLDINLLDDCVSKSYLTRKNELIVNDDFSVDNFKMAPPQDYDFNLLSICIKKLAKYHASSILLEEIMTKRTGKMYRIGDHYPEEVADMFSINDETKTGAKLCKTGLRAIGDTVELFPDIFPDKNDFVERWKTFSSETYEIIKTSTKYRNVLSHSDLWSSNILVKYDGSQPTDCRFVDFQIIRYIPPAHDLLGLLYLNVDRTLRMKIEQQSIKLYYTELTRNLSNYGCDINDIYTYEQFVESYEFMKPQMVSQNAFYTQLITCKTEMDEYLFNEEKCKEVLFGSRKEFVFYLYKNSELFRNKYRDCFLDLADVCNGRNSWL